MAESGLHVEHGDLITVIIPVYNVAGYLNECLLSIQRQSYQNLQVILVDDGSTDGSEEICNQWIQRDLRFEVLHQKNMGVSTARNEGLKRARGQYICFVDADDVAARNMIEFLHKEISTSDLVFCLRSDFIEKIPERSVVSKTKKTVISTEQMFEWVIKNHLITCSVCGILFSRKSLEGICFDPRISYYEDFLFLYSVLKQGGTVVFINESLYYYRQRPGSASHSLFNRKMLTMIDAWDMIMKDSKEVFPGLYRDMEIQYFRNNLMCAMLASRSDKIERFMIKRFRKGIKKYMGAWLFSNLSCNYKILALALMIHWNFFVFLNRRFVK